MKTSGKLRWFALMMSAVSVLCSACTPQPPERNPDDLLPVPVAPIEDVELVWQDEFDGNSLNSENWEYQLGIRDVYHGIESNTLYWGNNELQYYTKEAVSVHDGMLEIAADRQDYEGMEFTSGRILTRDLQTFTYGYFEAKMKTPAIEGMWPAFWMLPQPTDTTSTRNEYGGWASNGEIDIMEAKGRLKNVIDNTLHYGGGWPNNRHSGISYTMETDTENWHVYAIDWQENGMTWYIDGKVSHSMKSSDWYTVSSDKSGAPFDVPFYLLFDLAVGGNYDGGRRPAADFTTASMYVDYVRVYQRY